MRSSTRIRRAAARAPTLAESARNDSADALDVSDPSAPHTEVVEPPKRKGNPAWTKGGVSPNPGGRPKDYKEVAAFAKKFTEEAILALADLMRNAENESARVRAAEILLERGWGKPRQDIDITSTTPVLVIDVGGQPTVIGGRPILPIDGEVVDEESEQREALPAPAPE